jgi:hypothetical protein
MTAPNLRDALTLVNQLSQEDRRALLQTLQEQLSEDDDSWALEGAQLAFMLQHQDQIESAYEASDLSSLDALIVSNEYRALFGDMPWDEAYDRFEETWWTEDE